jgi:hypothetical protein
LIVDVLGIKNYLDTKHPSQDNIVIGIASGTVAIALDTKVLREQFKLGAEYSRNNPQEPTIIAKCRALQALWGGRDGDIPLDEVITALKAFCKETECGS